MYSLCSFVINERIEPTETWRENVSGEQKLVVLYVDANLCLVRFTSLTQSGPSETLPTLSAL